MNTISGNGDNNVEQPVFKQVAFVLLGAGLILLVPLVAMQFTNEVVWDRFDFVVAGVLLVSTGLIYVFATRMVRKTQHRFIIGAVLAVAFLLVWAELAVGIFGSPFAGT
jgi:hypothetical protein